MKTRHCWILVLCSLAVLGCRQAESARDLLAEAEYLCLEQRYDEAKPLLKELLLQAPRHAGAHFYLGTCFLNSPEEKWLMIAKGEFETAIAAFIDDGRANPIERFSNATYFEMICHIRIVEVHLRQMQYLVINGAPPGLDTKAVVDDWLAECRSELEAARAVDPDAPEIAQREELVDAFEAAFRAAQRDSGFQRRGQV